MRSFWGLIPRNLKKNKKRTFSLSIGIILSVMLIMALFIMKEVYMKVMTEDIQNRVGIYCDLIVNTTDSQGLKKLNRLMEDDIVEKGTVKTFSFADVNLDNTDYTIKLNGYEENVTDFISYELIEGRKPEKDNEIVLEDWILPFLHEDYKVGDSVKFNCTMVNKQKEKITRSYEFKLVGIFKYNSDIGKGSKSANGWVTREFAEKNLEDNNLVPVIYQGYINIKDGYSIKNSSIMLNNDERYSNLYFVPYNLKVQLDSFGKFLNVVCYILFFIIGIVVSINIYNIFAVTVMERRKEFGILRALGSTGDKVKLLVMSEAMIVGIISIILGIILGNVITKGLLVFLGAGTLKDIFVFHKGGISASLIIGILSVMAGTYFPGKRAAKVSPMEAINDNGNVGDNNKKMSLDQVKILNMNIGFSEVMGIINLKRNKKKFITSVISLSLTLILIMSACYLIGQIDPTKKFRDRYGEGDFKVEAQSGNYLENSMLEDIKGLEDTKILSQHKTRTGNILLGRNQLTEDGYNYHKGETRKNDINKENFEKGIFPFPVGIYAYDKEDLDEFKDKLLSGTMEIKGDDPVLFLIQGIEDNYTDVKAGDEIKIRYDVYDDAGTKKGDKTIAFKVGAILKKDTLKNYNGMVQCAAIVDSDIASKYLDMKGYNVINLGIKDGKTYEEAKKELQNQLGDAREVSFSSFKEEYTEQKRSNAKLCFILYGFVFVIGTISTINLINIMKMNVLTRRKEIGMFRATGFGIMEVKRMIVTEGMAYGVTSGIIGTLAGTGLTYFIYLLITGVTWKFPLASIIILTLSSMLITSLASLISSRELFKTSIVDSIRAVE